MYDVATGGCMSMTSAKSWRRTDEKFTQKECIVAGDDLCARRRA